MTRAARAAAAALFACALAAGTARAGEADADLLERVFEVAPDVRVEIEIVTGEIELRATSANELRVRAKGPIEVKGSHRRVSVRAASAGWMPWSQPADVDVEIELPRKSRIAARAINGGIKADGVEGELDLHAANGAIEVKGAPEETYLETMNAPIRFQGRGSGVVAKTLNGAIELEGVSGEVQASTVSGRIKVEGEAIERAELRTMAGEIELDSSLAKSARVSAKSFSGPVVLRLPKSTSARFDVQSWSGGLESDFASRLGGDDDHGHDRSWGHGPWGHGAGRPLSFVVGEGDARISIESFSGGVKIEESGG
ncbi:MAG TPA: DUF4097 family beta strand repeat-containing protein [Myxococcota bacterium]|nr:DUF4097 family beta strand repeat-containing protein [Myxococcota bacterium]